MGSSLEADMLSRFEGIVASGAGLLSTTFPLADFQNSLEGAKAVNESETVTTAGVELPCKHHDFLSAFDCLDFFLRAALYNQGSFAIRDR
jgi:hypothetical protein